MISTKELQKVGYLISDGLYKIKVKKINIHQMHKILNNLRLQYGIDFKVQTSNTMVRVEVIDEGKVVMERSARVK